MNLMADVVHQAVVVASVKEVSWSSVYTAQIWMWRLGELPEKNSQN